MMLKKIVQYLTDDLCKNTKSLGEKDARLVSLFTVAGTIIAASANTTEKDDVEKELMSWIDICDKEYGKGRDITTALIAATEFAIAEQQKKKD